MSGMLHERRACPRVVLAGLLLISALMGGCGKTEVMSDKITNCIGYIDVVCFDGVHYLWRDEPVERDAVGPVVFTVTRMLYENETDPSHVLQSGEAALLPVGTEFHALEGYAPSFRLVCEDNGELRMYEADSAENARVGEDLLDIRDKVDSIDLIELSEAREVVATISDSSAVDCIVTDLLEASLAPIDSGTMPETILLALRLKDGTSVLRSYWEEDGSVGDGMILSEDSQAIIEALMPRTPLVEVAKGTGVIE